MLLCGRFTRENCSLIDRCSGREVLLQREFNGLKGFDCEAEEVGNDCQDQQDDREEAQDCFEDQQSSDPSSSAVAEGGHEGILETNVAELGVKTEVIVVLNTEVVAAVDHGDVAPVLVANEVEDARGLVVTEAVVIITERGERENVVSTMERVEEVEKSDDDSDDGQDVQPTVSLSSGEDSNDAHQYHHDTIFIRWGEEVREGEDDNQDTNNHEGSLDERMAASGSAGGENNDEGEEDEGESEQLGGEDEDPPGAENGDLLDGGALLESQSVVVVVVSVVGGALSVALSAGTDELVAAGGIAALLELSHAGNTIAADLVRGVNANAVASLGLSDSSSDGIAEVVSGQGVQEDAGSTENAVVSDQGSINEDSLRVEDVGGNSVSDGEGVQSGEVVVDGARCGLLNGGENLGAASQGQGSLTDNPALAILVSLAGAWLIDGLEAVDSAALERAGVEKLSGVAALVAETVIALTKGRNCDVIELRESGRETAIWLRSRAATRTIGNSRAWARGVEMFDNFSRCVAALRGCGVERNTAA